MITEKINPWLNFAANLGLIAGLILVAMQIQQDTEITKAQIANDYFLADMDLELPMMGDDPARSWPKAVYAPDEIDQHDAAVLDRYFNYGVVQIQRLPAMHELGLAPDHWQEPGRMIKGKVKASRGWGDAGYYARQVASAPGWPGASHA